MNDKPLQSVDLLSTAASLRRSQVDKMAHAVGWPDTHQMRLKRGDRRMRREPYRNYFNSHAACPDWSDAEEAGLAYHVNAPDTAGGTYWHLTDLGKKVVRIRLEAVREANR